MKVIRLLSVSALALAIAVMFTANAAAQGNTSSDLLTADQVKELAATAKTPADHMKLSKHFAAEAARNHTAAAKHDAVAQAYRKNPNASESKRPGAPDTALHCERLAQLAREEAKEARALAAEHEHMAKK